MQKFLFVILTIVFWTTSFGQKLETVYLNSKDSTADMYIAVIPENKPIKAFMFLLDGFGASPKDVLVQTQLPIYAAKQGILTIIPILKTGPLYFGVDSESIIKQSNRKCYYQILFAGKRLLHWWFFYRWKLCCEIC